MVRVVLREADVRVQNRQLHDALHRTLERARAERHRVQRAAQRPNVHFVAVATTVRSCEDFWSNVVGSATERLLSLVGLTELRGETQVANLDFQVVIEEDICKLQIAVDDAAAVEILDGVDDLEKEVLDLRLCETLSTLHEVTQCLLVRLQRKKMHIVRT